MTEKKERGQKEKKNRGCSACSSDGLAGWFVCLFSLWRWWELSIGHCQFSPHWENIHVDSWNPESRVKQTRGQQIQDSARMKHFQIKKPSKSSFSSLVVLKMHGGQLNWRNMSVTSQQSFLAILRVLCQKRSWVVTSQAKKITKPQCNTESKRFQSLKTTEGFN